MIQMHDVTKCFVVNGRKHPILQVRHWEVAAEERIALIGPSGSGKSTLLHLLSGVVMPDSGQIAVGGCALHELSESERDRFRASQVGYIFQDFHLIPSLTLKQNVELVAPASWSSKDRRERLDSWFERVGLQDRQLHLPYQLSRGQQQRAAMIRALIARPALVLADEPTGSLDWETASDIMSLLLAMCKAEKLTLITVTHDLHLAKLFPKQVHIHEINGLRQGAAV